MRLFLIATLLFAVSLSGQGQRVLHVSDALSDAPIPGVFYAIDTLYFGTSDAEGLIDLPGALPRGLAITVSHVAYADTTFLLPAAPPFPWHLRLRPSTIKLPEIKVSDFRGHKFRSPAHLVRNALRKVKENYPLATLRQTGLYREAIAYDDCPVIRNEAFVEVEISPYDKKFKLKKAWREAWDRHYTTYQGRGSKRFRYLGSDKPEGTIQYTDVADRYRILRSRISLAQPPHDFYYWFRDGLPTLLALDKVRLGYDYLGSRTLKEYDFTLVDSVIVNGAYCYHLRFSPANNEAAAYFPLSKQQRVGVFTGDLYIDQRNLAIVRFAAVNTKVIHKNSSAENDWIAPVGSFSVEVDYALTAQGVWALSQVQSKVNSSAQSGYTAIRTLKLNEGPPPIPTPGKDRWRYQNFKWSLHSLTRSYDEAFWSAFEQSTFYKSGLLGPADCAEVAAPGLAEFRAPFDVDTVRTPTARPLGTVSYVKESRIKKAWEWLEDPTDSATTAYLRWENDYYDQYFRWNYAAPERVGEQFGRRVQGWPEMEETAERADTLFRVIDGQAGFYRFGADRSSTLLFATEPAPPGFVTTDVAFRPAGLTYVVTENRRYDKVITVYDSDGKVTDRDRIDDFRWRGDTLYATRNTARLRTASVERWTAAGGWGKLLAEDDPTRQFRFADLPDGGLILIAESLTEATIHRLVGTEWVADPETLHPLFAGTGPLGAGCEAELGSPVDFVYDCRTNLLGTCVSAQHQGRREAWIRAKGRPSWTRIDLPTGLTSLAFVDGKGDKIMLAGEGVARYGTQYRVNFDDQKLEEINSDRGSINLVGYRDSIVWVSAPGGEKIPCQLRWKTSFRDSLRGTLLKVYAAYGTPALAGHREEDIALMNLGHAIAYVYARGGGTRGPGWYDAGREANKLVGCKDYLAAVKFFSKCHPLGPTPISGFAQSAGGPLLGYAVNETPELFTTAIFDHAYLDVASTMSRPELPLTTVEYPEWGNPKEKRIRQAQAVYSPFDNVSEQAYPRMLFLAGRYDQSTPYWQIAKYVAAVRKANTGEAPILFHTAMKGSHPGTPFGPGMGRMYEWLGFLVGEN